eukprot:351012-Chlamydomonas_euryale.AAC.16
MVVNLDDGVAVTQNFVSRTNLPHVMRFLRTGRADTISGLDKVWPRAGERAEGKGVEGEGPRGCMSGVAFGERGGVKRTRFWAGQGVAKGRGEGRGEGEGVGKRGSRRRKGAARVVCVQGGRGGRVDWARGRVIGGERRMHRGRALARQGREDAQRPCLGSSGKGLGVWKQGWAAYWGHWMPSLEERISCSQFAGVCDGEVVGCSAALGFLALTACVMAPATSHSATPQNPQTLDYKYYTLMNFCITPPIDCCFHTCWQSERHELHDRFLGALKRQLPAVAAQYESERDAKRRRIEADNRLAAMFKSEAAAAGTPGTSPLGGEGTQSADVEGSGDSGGKARAVHGGAHGNFRMGGAAASAGSVAADLPAASNGELHGGGFSFGFKL